MIKNTILLLALSLFAFGGYAQNKTEAINLSLWSPIATVPYDTSTTVLFNIGLFHSKIHNLSYFGVNGIGGSVDNVRGIQASGIYTYINGPTKGIVLSGLVNVAKGETFGIQGAMLLNMNTKSFNGLQGSVLSNITLGDFRGLQLTGAYNVVAGTMQGIQFGSLANVSGKGEKSIQLAGGFNISLESHKGAQIAIGNFADTLSGFQFGLINISSKVNKGAQIGIVNFFNDPDAGSHFGLVNITRNSRVQMMFYGSNCPLMNIAARVNNNSYYSIVGLGMPYYTSNGFSGSLFYRFGKQIPLKKSFALNFDSGYAHVMTFDNDNDNESEKPMQEYSFQARTSVEYKFRKKISFFVGAGYSMTSKYGYYSFTGRFLMEGGILLF